MQRWANNKTLQDSVVRRLNLTTQKQDPQSYELLEKIVPVSVFDDDLREVFAKLTSVAHTAAGWFYDVVVPSGEQWALWYVIFADVGGTCTFDDMVLTITGVQVPLPIRTAAESINYEFPRPVWLPAGTAIGMHIAAYTGGTQSITVSGEKRSYG